MAYAITKDHLPNADAAAGTNGNATGLIGPRSVKLSFEEIVTHPKGQKFRMLDDDGEVYYEGIFVGDDEFQPLDFFGTPTAGCTSIEYWNPAHGGTWQPL